MKKIYSDPELIEHFLNSFESAGTQNTYRRSIEQYRNYMEREAISLQVSTEHDVAAFLKERSQSLGSNALRLQMACLKSLYKFGVQFGYLDFNIMSKFKLSKAQSFKSTSDFAFDEEPLKLLKHIDTDTLIGARQHALVCLTYYSLLKITDALNLRFSDIVENDHVYVAKVYNRNVERIVPIPAEAISSLNRYIDLLPHSMISESNIFIRTEGKGSAFVPGKPFTGMQASTQLRNYRRGANLSDALTFETIRQAGLRRLIRTGTSLSRARELYGCKSFDTIEAILGPEFRQLR